MILRFSAAIGLALVMSGCAGNHGGAARTGQVQRYGMVIGVKPEKLDYYKQLHAQPWPGVLRKITECNINNYSIYLKQVDEQHWYLFGYFEYTGNDFDADMKKMAADPETQRWWGETDPCQIPVPLRGPDEQWAVMEEVFHLP